MLDNQEVKVWLEAVERQIYALAARTNFYDAAKSGYHEIGLFGTEACVMSEHWERGAVCHAMTAGEYWIGQSATGEPDTLYRRVTMSVLEVVEAFVAKEGGRTLDWSNCDPQVKSLYDGGNYASTLEIIQAIEPNPEWSPVYGDFRGKRWRSIWWHASCGDKKKLLRRSGYEEQPFWAPRWATTGNDVYGNGPGHDALPDLRVLQAQAIRKGQVTDRVVDPELVVPASMAGKVTGRPGNVIASAEVDISKKAGPIYAPAYQALALLREDIVDTRSKVDESAYADLFMAITNMAGVQPRTVEEIASRNEEKLTQLGPVIERVNVEKLQVALDRMFGILSRGGMFPPAPKAVQGLETKTEFVSILTQMQRLVGLGQIERPISFIGNLAGAFPEVLDNIDGDKVAREYGDRAGMPASLFRPSADVVKIRQARAAAEQAAKAAAAMPAVKDGAAAAQLLSETDTGDGRSALQAMLGG